MSDSLSSSTIQSAFQVCSITAINWMLFLIFGLCFIVALSGKQSCAVKENYENTLSSIISPFHPNAFQKVALTPVDKNNMLFGEAQRHIIDKDITFVISANLYVLNGNIHTHEKAPLQKYIVYLSNENLTKQQNIGEMKKDGDGIYKLLFTTDVAEIKDLKNIYIVLNKDNTERILINGSFRNKM